MGGGWSAPRPGSYTPGKDPVPIVQEAGWAPGPVWTGAENLAPTGIRSAYRPARSESLYRLSYRGPPGLHMLSYILFSTMFLGSSVSTGTPCRLTDQGLVTIKRQLLSL